MRKKTQSKSVFRQENTPIRSLNVIQTNHVPTKAEKFTQWLGVSLLFLSIFSLFLGLAGLAMIFIRLDGMQWYVPGDWLKYQAISIFVLMLGSWFFLAYSERKLIIRFNKSGCWFNQHSDPLDWSDLEISFLMRNRVKAQTTQSQQAYSFELKIGSPGHGVFHYSGRGADVAVLKELLQFLPQGALSCLTTDWTTPVSGNNRWRAHSVANKSRKYAAIFGFISLFLWMTASIVFMPDLIMSGILAFTPYFPQPDISVRSDEYMGYSMVLMLMGGGAGAWLINWGLEFTRDYLSADKDGLYSKQHGLIPWDKITCMKSFALGRDNGEALQISFLNPASVMITHRWQVGLFSSVAKFAEVCEAGCLEFGQLRPD
ncbi:hypothetical protein HA050_20955 [Iodobacter sp. HSC-16F04]|uniref:Uncharacterized protein n=1 Tax=Iodobacter violaceini TaxID=3044271 RepID=A0ABX0L227_9NEIS|nr:hypothetical protein [Iodobacter violacea]NHQ88572.1 hypothetical protein [Iodobacter violacea]